MDILINCENIQFLMKKLYLLHPIAIELYDEEAAKMHFFNFFDPDVLVR